MMQARRGFLKLLSMAPLVAASACSAQKSRSAPKGSSDSGDAPSQMGPAATTPRPADGPKGRPAYESRQCALTGRDILGPFHRDGAPKRTVIAPKSEPGRRLAITGQVLHQDCRTPVAGAILDIWHADAQGRYDNTSERYRLRGQVVSDENGRYTFETIVPGNYPLGKTMRPAHIHFNVSSPGFQPLTTQLYFEDDPYLKPNDPCAVCNSGDPTLVIALKQTQVDGRSVSSGIFDIRLATMS